MKNQNLTSTVGNKPTSRPLISIIMPALNEEKAIGKVISEVAALLKSVRLPFEIIVVDDGSIDETVRVAQECGAIVLVNRKNQGKGYCLRKGLIKAKGDLIVTMDSDGEHRPADIVRLLEPALTGVDVVAGSRFICRAKNCTSECHIFGNYLFNICIMLLTGKKVTDSQTGFRVLKRKVLDSLCLQSDGYEIESEITMKTLRNGFSLVEVPIRINPRAYGITRIKLLSDGTKILRTILMSSLIDVVH